MGKRKFHSKTVGGWNKTTIENREQDTIVRIDRKV